MSIFKSDLFLTIIVLVLFGIYIVYSTGVLDPLLTEIGDGMRSFVRSKFGDITSP